MSTKSDRTLDTNVLIPAGAVGRVVSLHPNDEVDVMLIGIGVVRYHRNELHPRKAGQVQFALQREEAWNALHRCCVLETTVGSRAWGLASETSDTDLRGAFVLPFPWTTGLVDTPAEIVSNDGSSTYWEVGKLIRQALRADPNTLETLFLPDARAIHPWGQLLLDHRDAFVSTEIHGTFGRYAMSQLKKLEQSMRLAAHRADVLEWLRAQPDASLDSIAAQLATVSTRAAPTQRERIENAKQYLKQLYRSMFDQGLLEHNDFASLCTFARSQRGFSLDLPRELRPKNAYNLVRLLATAIHWLETGTPEFRVAEPLRSQLLAIKHGDVPLDSVLHTADSMMPQLEQARIHSSLPRWPDAQRANALLSELRRHAASASILQEASPWGKNAPEAPVATWASAASERT